MLIKSQYELKLRMMRILLVVSIFTFMTVLSCKNSDSYLTDNSDFVIKAGFICGWGAGEDSIEISQTGIKYVYYVPRQSQKPQITKSRSISGSEWIEIMKAVNMDDFVKLDYQTCNVCFDGCDEWIFIEKDKVSHEIRFDKGATIDTISKLQLKLRQLRAEFHPQLK